MFFLFPKWPFFTSRVKKNPPWGLVSYVISLTFSLIPWQTLFLVKSVVSRKEWGQKRGMQWRGLTQGSTAPTLAEAATAKERRSRTRVLLSVVEGFALCFISSSQAMQAKFSEHHWCGASFTQHCCVSFWSLLVLKELKKMKELIWVDRAFKDQFQSGFCSSHLTVGKEN